MTTWRTLLSEALAGNGESWDDVKHVAMAPRDLWRDETPPSPSLDAEFSDNYGSAEGCPFTLWTSKRVYFPVVYDGAEWVSSVPRDPCDEATPHVGGQ